MELHSQRLMLSDQRRRSARSPKHLRLPRPDLQQAKLLPVTILLQHHLGLRFMKPCSHGQDWQGLLQAGAAGKGREIDSAFRSIKINASHILDNSGVLWHVGAPASPASADPA